MGKVKLQLNIQSRLVAVEINITYHGPPDLLTFK